ncbi:MAG: hypothetical protein P8174_05900, partial [Gemmatimonadota bacterium]
VVGGLTVSTLLTLFVVPSAYLIFNTAAERLGIWLTGRRAESAITGGPEAAPADPASEPARGD